MPWKHSVSWASLWGSSPFSHLFLLCNNEQTENDTTRKLTDSGVVENKAPGDPRIQVTRGERDPHPCALLRPLRLPRGPPPPLS